MEKMKEVEKDETVAFGEGLKVNGVLKKTWPVRWRVPLVKAKRPAGVISAMPSRVRFCGFLKLLKMKLRLSSAADVEGRRERRSRREERERRREKHGFNDEYCESPKSQCEL